MSFEKKNKSFLINLINWYPKPQSEIFRLLWNKQFNDEKRKKCYLYIKLDSWGNYFPGLQSSFSDRSKRVV